MPMPCRAVSALLAAALYVLLSTALAPTASAQTNARGGNEDRDPSQGADGQSTFGSTARGRADGRLRLVVDGCLKAGTSIEIIGPIGTPPGGGAAVMLGTRLVALTPTAWSDGWMKLTMPPEALPPDAEVGVEIMRDGQPAGRIGSVSTCSGAGGFAGGSGVGTGFGAGAAPPLTGGRTAMAPNGRPEVIVSIAAAGSGAATAALQAQGATLLRSRPLPSLGESLLVFSLPDGLPLGGAQAVLDAAAPGAVIAPHNLYFYAAGPRIFAREMVGAPEGCALAGPVRIGVIDGPIDLGHPALSGQRVRVRSFVPPGQRAAPADHGTAVAALIAGSPAAGPLAGFAPGAEIYSAEVFARASGDPEASVELIGAALDWLAAEGVRLANLSFSGPWNRVLERLIGVAAGRGAVLVAAAGNDGSEAAALPAGAPGVIAVTAIDAAHRPYARANRGRHIAFAAPGVDLWTAKAGGGGYSSGTSFAAPIVTAFAARLLARTPALDAGGVRDQLRATTLDLGAPGHDPMYGWGLARSPGC